MKPKVLFAGSSKSKIMPALAVALASMTTAHAVELLVDGVTTEPAAGTYTYDATSGNSGIRNGGTFKVNSDVNVTVNNSNNNVWFGIGDGTGSSLLWLNGGSMIINSNWGTVLGRTANGTITIDSGSLTVNKAAGIENGILIGEMGGKGEINLNSSGTLTTYKISSAGAVNTQVFNFNGGTLTPTVSKVDWFAYTGNILTQVRNGGAKIDTAGFDVTISEQLVHSTIGGDNAIDGGLTKEGGGILTLSEANTFTGAVVVNDGTLLASTGNSAASGAFSFASGITVNNGATLQSGTNSLFGYDGTKLKNITVNTGGVLTMNDGSDVNVGNVTLAGGTLAAIGTNHAGYGSWVFRNNTVLSVTENSTVSATNVFMKNGSSIDVAVGKTLDFTGTLTNTFFDGNGALIKIGDGTLTLTGTNTYTGETTVADGTLALNGSGSIGNSSVIDVQGGASLSIAGVSTSTTIGGSGAQTLKGTGSVDLGGKTMTVGTSGILAPGSSPGTLEFAATAGGKLDFAAGSTIDFELGTSSDQISFSSAGDWLSGAGNATLALSLLTGFDYSTTYTIFQNVTTSGFTLNGITGYDTTNYTASFLQDGSNYKLSFTPVPEPRAALLGGLGLLCLLRRRRG